ncbi:MAG: NAD(P)/FAD-dependent oxidoreductase [Clostridia bacterium]|nr:NAD(P)/FAD-dependent oxidoreductase [Clostridia bacterium]
MKDVIVVGAGAAGTISAGFAARRGFDVTLVERNERPCRKVMITGKGRCNLTNNCGLAEFLENVPRNARFLYSAVTAFGPSQTMDFFEKLGVPLKTERGRRVFPQSDRAADIAEALAAFARVDGCRLTHGRVTALLTDGGRVRGVRLEGGRELTADAVIVCTGGKSYPLTGSTGDGYALAESVGHTIIPPAPSLVPIETQEPWVKELQGLSLRNAGLEVINNQTGKTVYSELGELLFTHFGVSGPLVLSASAHMREGPEGRWPAGRYTLRIDLKPGLDLQKLDARLQRDFSQSLNRDFRNSLGGLLPAKLIPVAVRLSGIPPELKVNQVTKEQRQAFALLIKGLALTCVRPRPVEEAVVTSGGVKTGEINPKTMESKLVGGLYFAGEMIDCDAYTGGYNLQIAFSTGFAAGNALPGGDKLEG